MKIPRVAMLIWHFNPIIGGAEKQCQLLSKVLIKESIPVFVVTERSGGLKSFEKIDGIPVYRTFCLWKLRKIHKTLKDFFLIYKLIKKTTFSKSTTSIAREKREKGKLLYIVQMILKPITYALPIYSFMLSSLFLLWRKRKEYDIIHVHEMHWIVFVGWIARILFKKGLIIKKCITGTPSILKGNLSLPFRIKMINDIRRNVTFIAISNEINKELLSYGIQKNMIFECPNGVTLPSLRDTLRENPEKYAYIACIGNLSKGIQKAIDVLLDSWKYVLESNKKIKLLIIGRKPYNNIFENRAKFLGINNTVQFLGFVKDPYYYYRRTSVFVLPSRREGLSNALLEAMSFGLPCVATDIPGNNDIIKDKINGLLVPKENPKALAEGILYMLNNPVKAKEMGREARKTIEYKYEIHNIAEKYIHLYMKSI